MKTPGLNRLEALQAEGASLFQGDRTQGETDFAYPRASAFSRDPFLVRGVWAPKIGLVAPAPLVRYVFANARSAAVFGMTQSPGGAHALHADEFDDGSIALTFGESVGMHEPLAEALRHAAGLPDAHPLGRYFVNVFPRSAFPQTCSTFIVPGQFCSEMPVRLSERIDLTAGDIRSLAALLGRELSSLSSGTVAHAAPFTGVYARGGDLQFDPHSGALLRHRTPTDGDRKSAISREWVWGRQWHDRPSQSLPPLNATAGSADARAEARRTSAAYRRATQYIEENCGRRIAVSEIADAAHLNPAHLRLLFRQASGCTPQAFVAACRLERMEHLLKDTDRSIAEIAKCCGFSDSESVSRTLRRRRGLSAGEFRDLARALGPK